MLSFCQVTKKPTANCAGKSNFKVHGQVRTNAQVLQDKCHTFDNCHTCLTFLSPQPETRTGALVWKLRQGGMQDLHRRRGKPQTPNNPTTLNPEPESRNPPTTNLHPPLPTLSPSPGAGRWLRLEQIRERQQLQVGLGPRLCPRSSPVLLLKRGNEPHNRGLGMHFCLGLVLKVTSRVIFFAPLALDAYQARGNRGLTQTQGRLIAGFYLFDTRLRHGLSGITIRVCCRICVCIVYTFAVGCLKRLRTTVNNHHPSLEANCAMRL